MDSKKIIFGLSPQSTLINSFILLVLSSLIWALKFAQQFSFGTTIQSVLLDQKDMVDNVPWYYDFPIVGLSIFMLIRWVENKFKLEKEDNTWKAFRYKYLYIIISLTIITTILKAIFLIIILNNKQ